MIIIMNQKGVYFRTLNPTSLSQQSLPLEEL